MTESEATPSNEPDPQRQAIEEPVIQTLDRVVIVTKSRMNYDFEAAAEDTETPTANSPEAQMLLDQAGLLTAIYAKNTGHDSGTCTEMGNRSLHIALRANGLIPKREL